MWTTSTPCSSRTIVCGFSTAANTLLPDRTAAAPTVSTPRAPPPPRWCSTPGWPARARRCPSGRRRSRSRTGPRPPGLTPRGTRSPARRHPCRAQSRARVRTRTARPGRACAPGSRCRQGRKNRWGRARCIASTSAPSWRRTGRPGSPGTRSSPCPRTGPQCRPARSASGCAHRPSRRRCPQRLLGAGRTSTGRYREPAQRKPLRQQHAAALPPVGAQTKDAACPLAAGQRHSLY